MEPLTEAEEDGSIARVLAEIPMFRQPLTVARLQGSAWARVYKITPKNYDGTEGAYFMKISTGPHGKESLKGEFESTSAIRAVVGDLTPKPIAFGSFKGVHDTHYYFCKFYELSEELPEPADFCAKIAELHTKSKSPNGKFGFHVVTYNGDLPQENGYTDTWEECFANGFRHMLRLNIERGGRWKEMEPLEDAMLSKVIPRLLRPLETGGRSVKPQLVHGDLWPGNVAKVKRTELPLIYDPASFYAHNEYELGNWRPERNKMDRFIKAYRLLVPESPPKEDYDDRNALYCMRFNLHAAALFPENPSFRTSVVEKMKRLVAKYPGGFEEYERTVARVVHQPTVVQPLPRVLYNFQSIPFPIGPQRANPLPI